jgi:hypothetical protein
MLKHDTDKIQINLTPNYVESMVDINSLRVCVLINRYEYYLSLYLHSTIKSIIQYLKSDD